MNRYDHITTPLLERAKMGALQAVHFASGGNIRYDYELNELPSGGNGAGLRVRQLIEDPASVASPPKITNYAYESPTVVNDPIRLNQTKYNHYYRGRENKVVTTSSFQNPLLSNKNNHVGYEKVTESWEGIGSVVHHFTSPDNIEDFPEISGGGNIIVADARQEIKKGFCPLLCTDFDQLSLGGMVDISDYAPSLYFPENSTYRNWLLGLEYENEVFNADEDGDDQTSPTLRQRTTTEYESATYNQHGWGSLVYFKSEMYQYNYPGSFFDHYVYRLIQNYNPFGGEIEPLITHLVDLVLGNLVPHPFKEIERNYFVSGRRIETGNIRPKNSTTTTYYLNGPNTTTTTSYSYVTQLTPKTVTTSFSDGNSTVTENIFAFENTDETAKFNGATLNHLNNTIGYLQPIASKAALNGQVVQSDFTALTTHNGKIAPLSNWTTRAGDLYLAGKFSNYNADGRPKRYKLARHNGSLFSPIKMTWNNRLQLTSRTYEGFKTTYNYGNTYFELNLTIDPNDIVTDYDYDSRWRINTIKTQNGRQTTTYTYNIEPGENYIQTDLAFTDGAYPNQVNTQFLDGFGKDLGVKRENDGASLSRTLYDNFFRVISQYNITSGKTDIKYEPSPAPLWTKLIDAVGNETFTETKGSGEYFQLACTTDANGHLSQVHTDGLGRTRKGISGEGGETIYDFDEFSRLVTITNPENDIYTYVYNEIDRVDEVTFPGSGPKRYWWDIAFRPIAVQDANGNTQLFTYDIHNRITQIHSLQEGSSLGNVGTIQPLGAFNGLTGDLLLENTYEIDHTWLKSAKEAVLTDSGVNGDKFTENISFDDIGRPASIEQTYPNGKVTTTPTYTDAGLIPFQDIDIISGTIGENIEDVSMAYTFQFDGILRPTQTSLDIDGSGSKILSRLGYNPQDLVKVKFLGESAIGGFLQKVDYGYDAAGKLLFINSPGEMECFIDDPICVKSAQFCFDLNSGDGNGGGDEDCDPEITSINIDGQFYEILPPLELTNTAAAGELEDLIEEALDFFGYFGEVSVQAHYSGEDICFDVKITDTNAGTIFLHQGRCPAIGFTTESCCEKETNAPTSTPGGNFSLNSDLFFEQITYHHLDISRIDMSSNCTLGGMRNEYTYDADHRVKTCLNIFFGEKRFEDRYSTNYEYFPAGSIHKLKRFGYVEEDGDGIPIYDVIDDLTYTYANGNGQLSSVKDDAHLIATNPNAQPKGFAPLSTNYSYDANGNITGGANNLATYNLLNLPKTLSGPNGAMTLDYTFGGEKIKIEGVKNKLYMGGVEYVNEGNGYEAETYYHGEGRVLLSDEEPRFQYKIDDHLGNLMVFFEDKDSNGEIFTESGLSDPTDPNDPNLPNLEVFQRHLYYPFGLNFEGIWDFDFEPENPQNDYLYNGKELDKETGSNWSFYGFRMYDATIGRFTGVDPISDQFAHVSTYNYAENTPINSIDLWGLQSYNITPGYNRQKWIEKGYTDEQLKGYDKANEQAETVTLVVASIFIPGPEDAVMGTFLVTKAGRFLSKAGDDIIDYVFGTVPKGPGAMGSKRVQKARIKKARGEQLTSEEQKAFDEWYDSQPKHNNTKGNQPAEQYRLENRDTYDLQKYGETTKGENVFGPGNQKRYTKSELDKTNSRYVPENNGTKKDMHNLQHEKIKEYKKNNNGKRPPLNKSDW